MIDTVIFDVGECLVDETREYGTWADWLGVPRHTFSAMFGAVIAKGLDYRETFQVFQPGFDLNKARQERADARQPERFGEDDCTRMCARPRTRRAGLLRAERRPAKAEQFRQDVRLTVRGPLDRGRGLHFHDLRHTGNTFAARWYARE